MALAAERSPDDWFKLVTEIQQNIEKADAEHRWLRNIDREDRAFVRKMVNELAVRQDSMPTAAQAQWLLAIKDWVEK